MNKELVKKVALAVVGLAVGAAVAGVIRKNSSVKIA